MKKIYLLNVILLFTLSACLVKDPEPREPTVVGTKTGGGGTNDNLEYTAPRCTISNWELTSSTSNYMITFGYVERTKYSQNIDLITITSSYNDKISVYVNNLNKKSANFKIVDTQSIEKNEAFIKIGANAFSQIGNKILGNSNESNSNNFVHISYDKNSETYIMSFCNVYLDISITQTQHWISGKFTFQ